ncbi:hypothetical protein [Methylocystis sp.]|uniref:hypothetical protein n=1 Tax=Methylocystis sp. TaxID=1911079 RepID=UPI003D0CF605
MADRWTHRACFDFFGVIPKNLRWSWSGRSLDGRTVAVTFWKDEFENGGKVYRSDPSRKKGKWVGSTAHKEFIENLIWSRDHCNGELHIIVATAKDVTADPRAIKECYPQKRLKMRLAYLDEKTGDFVAERIDNNETLGA